MGSLEDNEIIFSNTIHHNTPSITALRHFVATVALLEIVVELPNAVVAAQMVTEQFKTFDQDDYQSSIAFFCRPGRDEINSSV
jgi:hypothetical protein